MSFSIARAPMLELLAQVMGVRPKGRSAFLGRFQHLQRLRLVEGINPGRGKAAEYKANHVLVIAITMQLLQLGLTPERAVHVIKNNQDRIRLAISLATSSGEIQPSFLWFDPALLAQSTSFGDDLADATFDYGGKGVFYERMAYFFEDGWMQRISVISVSNTVKQLVGALEDSWPNSPGPPKIGAKSRPFIEALSEWYKNSTPDSLA